MLWRGVASVAPATATGAVLTPPHRHKTSKSSKKVSGAESGLPIPETSSYGVGAGAPQDSAPPGMLCFFMNWPKQDQPRLRHSVEICRKQFHILTIVNELTDLELWRHTPSHASAGDPRRISFDRTARHLKGVISSIAASIPGGHAMLVHGKFSFDVAPFTVAATRVDHISLIRRPTSRAVSAYTHLRRGQQWH